MKIAGQELAGELAQLNEEILVLPRKQSQIILTARALADMDEFNALMPQPMAPQIFRKGKGWGQNNKDKNYVSEMTRFGECKLAWMVLKSLEPSEIEWDTVDMAQPATWKNWETDLRNSSFTQHECNLVLELVLDANQLNESKLEQARELFVLGQEAEADKSSSQNTEPGNTPSGEPA